MFQKIVLLFLLFASFTGYSQSWKQIGITNPTQVYEPNQGDLYPYGIGVIWDLRFEREYDGKKKTRLFATGISSGLWLSPSGKGNDWKLLNTDFLPETSIGDFDIHPKNRNKIIIGTGVPKLRQSRNKDLFALPKSKGVFTGTIDKNNKIKWKSNSNQYFHDGEIMKDNNTFWTERTKCIAKLCYSLDGSALIMCIVEEESPIKYNTYVYRSLNGGYDWYLKAAYPNLFFHDLEIDPLNQDHMILCCNFDKKVDGHFFESTDLGDTWKAVMSEEAGLNDDNGFFKLCFDSQTPSKLWICKSTENGNYVYTTTDCRKIELKKFYKQWHNAGSCCAIDVSEVSNNFFSVGSVSLHAIFNADVQNISTEMHSDIRAISYYPGSKNMVVANDGGVTSLTFDSIKNIYHIQDVSLGLEIGRVTNVSSSSYENYGFANWDNSCRWVNSQLKGYKYYDLFGNESNIFEINDSAILDGSAGPTSAVLYVFDHNLNMHQGPYYYGDFFTFVPNEKSFFYVNGTQLHQVNYEGNPAEATDKVAFVHPQGDKSFLQARIAPGNNKVIYTATQQQGAYYHFQIFKSEDGGKTWTEYNTQPYGGFLSDIAIDPENSEKICVGSVSGEVFFSENSGKNFSNNTLPSDAGPVNTLTYMSEGAVLAACDNGLWIYSKGKLGIRSWRKFNSILPRKANKLPDCRITDVEYLPATKTIRAATMGRGVFECQIKKGY